jgi:hypothetical protein
MTTLIPSLTSRNLADVVAREELKKTDNYTTLKELYVKLLSQLAVDGIPHELLSSIGQKIIVEKKRTIKRGEGYTHTQIKNINIGSWWYDVVREVQLTRIGNNSTPEPDKKIVPPSQYEKENVQYINLINDTIELLRDIVLPKLKTNHLLSLLDGKTKKESELVFHDWKTQLVIGKSLFDHKEKIPPNTQHILLHAISTTAGNNSVTTEYYNQRIEAHKLTGKQLAKYRKGMIKSGGPAILEIHDRVIALLWNYMGVKCVKCKSWRVRKLNIIGADLKGECLDCNNTMDVTQPFKCCNVDCQMLFYEDDMKKLAAKLKKIDTNNKNIADKKLTPSDKLSCPECEEIFTPLILGHIRKIN